jgi:hypothetical protein
MAGESVDVGDAAEEVVASAEAIRALLAGDVPEATRRVLEAVAESLAEAAGYLGAAPMVEAKVELDTEAESETATEGEACPVETQDIAVNLKNRQRAIDVATYGPANPNEPGDYWQGKADRMRSTVEQVKTMVCGNCAFFNVTTRIKGCIEKGIGVEGEVIERVGELGLCEAFDFKCAAKRTCDAWVVGGPITDTSPAMVASGSESTSVLTTEAMPSESVAAAATSAGVPASAVALNGAQVQAAQGIIMSVAKGELPRDSGVQMLIQFFNMAPDAADALMGEVGRSFTISAPEAP